MKILFLSPTFDVGGAEKVSINLANYLSKDHDIYFLPISARGKFRTSLNDKVKIIRYKNKKLRFNFFLIRKDLKKIKPDVIISNYRTANIISFFLLLFLGLKSKVVFREANLFDDLKKIFFFKRCVYLLLLKISYSISNLVIANSLDTKQDLLKHTILSAKKIKVIQNPVLEENYKSLLNKKIAHKWYSNKYEVITNVGRLTDQKNQSILILSFKELLKERKNLRLILIGSGIKRKELKQMVVKYRLNNYVDFIPYTNNIYSHLSKSSIFVLCSKWEGFGNVVVEALASGTKVIVSNCKGGPKNIIKGHKQAKTFKNNSLNDLTKKIKEIFYVKNQPIKKKLNKYFISYVALKYLNEIKKI